MSQNAIEISDLTFSYGKENILDGITVKAKAGEYISIIGPNGAGKSTLLKCLNRINLKKSGSIRLFGKELEEYTQKEIGRLIGYVAQNREQNFPYTVFEFVRMGRYPYLNPWLRVTSEDLNVVDNALALTGLTGLGHRPVSHLSGGEKQKVYIAAALAQQPKILLLDEPTTHLDPKYQMEIQKTVKDICAQMQITILHVTHELNHIFAWSQKILAMKHGKIFAEGTPREILNQKSLKAIFDTDFILVPHPSSNQQVILPKVL